MSLPDDTSSTSESMQAIAGKHWKSLLFEGILLTVCGLAAILLPVLASLTITVLLGWLLIMAGAVALVLTFWSRQAPGFWWSLLSAVVALIAGTIMLLRPIESTLTLTIIVGAYFLAEGAVTIIYAVQNRGEFKQRWGWLLAAGIADLLVAIVIIAGFPETALWAIGLLVGINLLFGGSSMIGVALAARPR
jgi:uncharacterized membrane protein HdeD (DUF308 family)